MMFVQQHHARRKTGPTRHNPANIKGLTHLTALLIECCQGLIQARLDEEVPDDELRRFRLEVRHGVVQI